MTGVLLAPAAFGQSTPTIFSLTPSSTPAGGPSFNMTVSGSGFETVFLNSSAVLWNGAALSTSYINSSELIAIVPASLIAFPGTASVTVVNPGGATSNAVTFTISQGSTQTPTLSSLNPSSATPGGPAFTLSVNGSYFQNGAVVQWNGSALSTSFTSTNQLSAFVPGSLIATPGSASITVVNPGGATSNTLTFIIGTVTTPTLLSLSPNATAAGGPAFTMTVNGSGFLSGAMVQWNGSQLSTGFINGNQLSAFVPANLIATQGSANVTAVNPGGAISNTLIFTIGGLGTPSIFSLSPSFAAAGGPGFTLTVNGSGFLNGATVQWNGSALTSVYFSGSQVGALVPASLIAAAGTASVTVVNPGGAISNALTFTIGPSGTPTLFSLSPNSIAAGASGFTLSVNGSGFVNGAVVQWNGAALATGFTNVGQLTAFVASNLIAAPGTANVTVMNPGGAVSNTLTFTIGTTGTPILFSLSPSFATAGGPAFTLAVNGSGFVNGAVVQWNGVALSTGAVSGNQLSAFVPASLIASPGSANVIVVNPSGASSNTLTFTITPAATVTLVSLSPSSTAAGGPGFTLTVNGSGFMNGAVVQWNGSVLSTSFLNASQLSAFVPASLIAFPGNANVTATNPGGVTSNTLNFVIGPAGTPALFSISPNFTTAAGPGFTLSVIGSGFVNGGVVQWNGTVLSTGFTSGNQLSAFVPASLIASAGTASVLVVNPGGAASNALIFTINASTTPGPTVSSLSPSSAVAGGPAFTLTVNGSGFVNGALVQWNGTSLPTSSSGSGTQLTASVPASYIASSGTANITVVNPNGPVSNAVTFSIFSFSSALRVAQIADGSNWKTLIQVVNLDQVPVNYSFQFWDDNGNPLQLPLANGVTGGTLAVGGTAFAETPGTAAALTQGWAEAASSGRIGVLTIFRQIVAGRPDAEGTVTGVQSGSRIFVPFDDTNGYVTGVAVANTNPTQGLFISLVFQLENGTQQTGSLSLPAHAHTAFELTSMFPALAGVRGSMELTASTPDVAVVGLRFSPTNSFTSLGQFQ
ncbi:MAG TPA: IPT/TIG domain-containing protein [Bryobacteraceae bacterium]|nr:IPT/TIG domain-containing protein [Bryobacteraceae bacterium]